MARLWHDCMTCCLIDQQDKELTLFTSKRPHAVDDLLVRRRQVVDLAVVAAYAQI